jgi:shikimate dehydrogenase
MDNQGHPDRGWPSAASPVVAVIGDPIAHSLSPLLHNAAFAALGLDWVSVGFRVPPGAARSALDAVRTLSLRGLSVTMPHKAAVAEAVDVLTPTAQRLDAVNCVIAGRDGRLTGDNTDGRGFITALGRGVGVDVSGMHCLVLGGGGAARAVVVALADAGAADVAVWARRPEQAAAAAELAGSVGRMGEPGEGAAAELVVNATPAGMAGTPSAGEAPGVDPETLSSRQVVVDLIYEPLQTAWLTACAARGATTLGGLGMLVHQAAVQLHSWTGHEAPVEAMWAAAEAAVGAR